MIDLPKSLGKLAAICDGEIVGDANRLVDTICSVDKQQANGLTFIANNRAAKQIVANNDAIYLVKPELQSRITNGIVHEQPQQAFRRILVALTDVERGASIDESARIHSSVTVGKEVTIGANTIIGEGVTLGEGCQIGCGVVIEANASIGNQSRIGHHVVIHHDTCIGQHCVISEGAVIGGQGFGFSFEGGGWQAIPQIGRVIMGNHVHVGANTCIDRGAINDTMIGNHVIIDNLVHIAHNVVVGDGTAMAAGVGIAGSTTIGKYCLLAGQVGVVGHIHIADNVQVNGGARVLQSIRDSGVYAGSLNVQPVTQWNRLSVYFKKIETLFKRGKSS